MAGIYVNPYFEDHPDFTPDPRASVVSEFKRLAAIKYWEPNSTEYRNERTDYLVSEYDIHLGKLDEKDKLEDFQGLCRKLGINDKLPSITNCKIALKTEVHVNLITLIDDLRGVGRVKVFGSRVELKEYTRRKGKYFPLECAKGNDLLKVLLRLLKK